MKAYAVIAPGQPVMVADWSLPELGASDVRVKVSACGLNFADLLMIKGTYQDTPPIPFVPGLEISGTILSVGAAVADLSPGDRISAYCGSGGLASEATVSASRCRKVPDTMSDTVAAGFQIAYGTSHLSLTRRARLEAGETLVVLGAAGGVGLTAVEIGKALGAHVIAVARGADKLEVARAAGADHVIDARTEDLRSDLKALGSTDVVYDAVGGALGEAALRTLNPEGRYLAIGFASGTVPTPKLNHLLVKNVDVIGVNWGGYLKFAPDALTNSLAELMTWHTAGKITPHIGHVFPFEQTPQALDLLRTRKSTGKIVVTL